MPVDNCCNGRPKTAGSHDLVAATHDKVIDPVCGMTVDPSSTLYKHQTANGLYHFCSESCRAKFAANPDPYLNPASRDPAVLAPAMGALPEAAEGTVWTCPMHPEVRRPGPESCPVCGMALEPLEPSLDEGASPELIDFTRRLAASVERGSEHPLAEAIVSGAEEKGLRLSTAEEFDSRTGMGVIGKVEGRTVALGNEALLEHLGISAGDTSSRAQLLRKDGEGVMFAAVDGELAGLIVVADPVKSSAKAAVKALRDEKIRIVMLTGDSRGTAEAVARKIGGIDEVIAEVLPDQKQAVVESLKEGGARVAMAGDGINDAPALAAADVGIAMGTGTDVAMESAAVTLIKGDLGALVSAVRLSRATMRNVRQNLFFAFIFNALAVPIAAGVLYPAFGILLSPIIAGAAMAFSSVTVIGNALRLKRVQLA